MNDSIWHRRPLNSWGARCFIAATVLSGWTSGCLGDAPIEDLGSTGGGVSAEPIPEKEFDGQLDPGFEGHWVGYVENPFERDELGQPSPAVFPSGSSQVTLDYRFGEYFEPSATLVFGASPAQVPEPGVTYPTGVNHFFANIASDFRAPIVEGFEYRLEERDPRYSGYDPGSASALGFQQFAAFEEWCAVQNVGAQLSGRYDCLGGADGFSGGDPLQGELCRVTHPHGVTDDVDCNFGTMCLSNLCACSADGCWLDRSAEMADVFLERQGDRIIGTISGATLDSGYPGWYVPMGTLHLFRAD